MHLEQVRWYHPCTCTRYNGHLPRCDSVKKRRELHRRTTSGLKGGTVVPHEGTGVVPSSRGTTVPLEGTSVVPSCMLDSARGALSTPSEPPPSTQDYGRTQPQPILTQYTADLDSRRTLGLGPLPPGGERLRQTAPPQKKNKNGNFGTGGHPPKPPF